MIVYGSSFSPFVRKVLVFAAEKGIELQVQQIGLGNIDPAFREASPFGKMPALRDGDYTLADSSAIVAYLEALHPEPALIPAEARARGKVIWWEEYGDAVVGGCLRKVFFNRVVAPRFLKREGDEAVAVAALVDEFPPLLDYLEAELGKVGDYLVGDGLTLADIAVASPLANLGHCDGEICGDRYPRITAYLARILARASFAHWLEKERRLLAR